MTTKGANITDAKGANVMGEDTCGMRATPDELLSKVTHWCECIGSLSLADNERIRARGCTLKLGYSVVDISLISCCSMKKLHGELLALDDLLLKLVGNKVAY